MGADECPAQPDERREPVGLSLQDESEVLGRQVGVAALEGQHGKVVTALKTIGPALDHPRHHPYRLFETPRLPQREGQLQPPFRLIRLQLDCTFQRPDLLPVARDWTGPASAPIARLKDASAPA